LKLNYKDILKLVVSIGLTVWVVSATTKEISWDNIITGLQSVEYGWVLLSIAISVISHLLRAYRWTLLLDTQNYKPGIFTTYLALMIGYLANMAIPRLGEVARCTVLNREEKIPVSFSLGTVITDRLLDLMMLGIMAVFLLSMEFELLETFFTHNFSEKLSSIISLWPYLLTAGLLGLALIIYLLNKAKRESNESSLFYKLGRFIQDLLAGIGAVRKVKRPLLFWLSTLGIWTAYFLMLYIISFGFAPTDDLSLMAGVAVLVMGSLGMAAPVNNGIGAYQALVAGILVLYGISETDGLVFAVVSHGSQLFSVIIIGFLSLMILNFRKRKKTKGAKQSENSQPARA
jgi:uncharacterized protein (TIRG00374 family)